MEKEGINELELYKQSLLEVLQSEGIGSWEDLDDDQRKAMIPRILDVADKTLPSDKRYYVLGYTLHNDRVQLATYPKHLVGNLQKDLDK